MEQLRQETNNFTMNICKVVSGNGYGFQKLPAGHPGLMGRDPGEQEFDVEGEPDGDYGFLNPIYTRTEGTIQLEIRRASRDSQATQRQPPP